MFVAFAVFELRAFGQTAGTHVAQVPELDAVQEVRGLQDRLQRDPNAGFEVLAGARYVDVEGRLALLLPAGTTTATAGDSWTDPVVGAREDEGSLRGASAGVTRPHFGSTTSFARGGETSTLASCSESSPREGPSGRRECLSSVLFMLVYLFSIGRGRNFDRNNSSIAATPSEVIPLPT